MMDKDDKEFIIIMIVWSGIFIPLYIFNVDILGLKFRDFTNAFFSCFAKMLMLQGCS